MWLGVYSSPRGYLYIPNCKVFVFSPFSDCTKVNTKRLPLQKQGEALVYGVFDPFHLAQWQGSSTLF